MAKGEKRRILLFDNIISVTETKVSLFVSRRWFVPVMGLKVFFPLLILVAAVILVFYRALFVFFAQDDFVWLRIAASVKKAGQLLSFFFQYNGASTYRPLTQELFFYLNYRLFGLSPFAFHLAAFVIHLINTILVYGILREMKQTRFASFAGTLFYAVNSAFFISLYWVSAVSESGMALFLFLCVFFFLKYLGSERSTYFFYILSFLAALCALMSKEPAIAIPVLLLIVYFYRYPSREGQNLLTGLRLSSPFIAIVLVYLGLRFATLGFSGNGPYATELNSLILVNLLSYVKWGLNNIDFTFASVAGLPGGHLLIALARLGWPVLLIAALFFFLWKHRQTFLFSASWFVVALVPVLPFVHHAQNYYVNVPVVAISVLVSSLAGAYRGRKRILFALLLVCYVFVSVGNVRFQEKNLWVVRRAEMAENTLRTIKAIYPKLPQDAVLYFPNGGEEARWAYNFGDLFRLYYQNHRMNVLFEDEAEKLRNVPDIKNLFVFLHCGGRVVDATEGFRRSGDLSPGCRGVDKDGL